MKAQSVHDCKSATHYKDLLCPVIIVQYNYSGMKPDCLVDRVIIWGSQALGYLPAREVRAGIETRIFAFFYPMATAAVGLGLGPEHWNSRILA